uniref:Broad-complex core protein isoform 6 n=1 Tax=Caligus rogercresseyi TaxID=217165 RepID=C1BRI5_CALRO|nr:Broad-complex core protein isoform 6 [Caligus rogercresseyi]
MDPSSNFLSLRWGNFEASFKESFEELRRNEELFDITLATESKSLKAHKIILSSCSPFFRHLIASLPPGSTHPLIYLRGIDFAHLEAHIAFMYVGEVRISNSDLNGFLKTATELKIKGLAQDNVLKEDADDFIVKEEPLPEVSLPESLDCETLALNEDGSHEEDSTQQEEEEIYSKSSEVQFEDESMKADVLPGPSEVQFEDESMKADVLPGPSEVQFEDESMKADVLPGPSEEHSTIAEEYTHKLNNEICKLISRKDTSGNYRCKKCCYFNPRRDTIKRHVEALHFSTSGFRCEICEKKFKTRQSLKNHKFKFHRSCAIFLPQ